MRQKILYAIWAALYILCVGLGTITEVSGLGTVVMVLTALLFFVPGVLLLADGIRSGSRAAVLRIRVICLCSLGLTVILLIGNILSVKASPEAGRVLHDLLQLVSAPMLCARYWWISLFCWSGLLMASFPRLWRSHSRK